MFNNSDVYQYFRYSATKLLSGDYSDAICLILSRPFKCRLAVNTAIAYCCRVQYYLILVDRSSRARWKSDRRRHWRWNR